MKLGIPWEIPRMIFWEKSGYLEFQDAFGKGYEHRNFEIPGIRLHLGLLFWG